jgi:hypothetical protein
MGTRQTKEHDVSCYSLPDLPKHDDKNEIAVKHYLAVFKALVAWPKLILPSEHALSRRINPLVHIGQRQLFNLKTVQPRCRREPFVH